MFKFSKYILITFKYFCSIFFLSLFFLKENAKYTLNYFSNIYSDHSLNKLFKNCIWPLQFPSTQCLMTLVIKLLLKKEEKWFENFGHNPLNKLPLAHYRALYRLLDNNQLISFAVLKQFKKSPFSHFFDKLFHQPL